MCVRPSMVISIGAMPMPNSAAISGGMALAESVTTATRGWTAPESSWLGFVVSI